MDALILPAYLLVAALCAWIDARSYRIPDILSLGFLALAIVVDSADRGVSLERLASAAAIGGVLYLAGALSGAGIGLGDVKLGAGGAYALGFGRAWNMLAISVLLGLLAFALAPRLRAGARPRIPFGPCLALGALAGALSPPLW